ncbi:MAG: hypothetical protein L6R19_19270 [Alphaproteobacteria bacterium]|nr:hypothetical protein [Alphaproteobacteria bacterium]
MNGWPAARGAPALLARGIGAILVAFLLMLSAPAVAASDDHGRLFPKKSYDGAALPSFESVRGLLPSPVLGSDPGYVELYWQAWALAFDHLRQPPAGSPLVSNYIDEGHSPNIFLWDTIFMVMFGRYGHHVFPFVQSLDNFYARQQADGYIPREIVEATGADFAHQGADHTVNPPLFAWAEWETYKFSLDLDRVRAVYPTLVAHAEWIEANRKGSSSVHGLYWNTPLGSGMDNSPRAGTGWTDMSAQVALMYRSLAALARLQGRESDAVRFSDRATAIARAVERFMWNEADGLYYDIDDQGNQARRKTVACFWPMLAGIPAPRRVERMIANLRDPATFWRRDVVPSLAADDPLYDPCGGLWRGGVWAPTNVAVIKGLDRYDTQLGTAPLTYAIVRRYLDNMLAVYRRTGSIWESYAPDSAAPGTHAIGDFVGWSGAGPIQLLIENILGIRYLGPGREIVWHVQRTDRHGIANLRLGKATITLTAQPRVRPADPLVFEVSSTHPVTLLLVRDGGTHRYEVSAGRHDLSAR